MVRITAREPLEIFADKIAERTGMTRQNVVHVLTSAMIVATEQTPAEPRAHDDRPGNAAAGRSATMAGARRAIAAVE